jgi:chromosome partitioning protein
MDGPAKLSVSNQKGGVGKTTIAINVAGALNARGRDVLFVDLDPQGNATEGLGFRAAYDDAPPSLFDVLTDSEQRATFPELVRDHPEMDVVPSNIDMTAAEPELTLARRGGEQLALALETVEDDYDYVLVDCPPHLGYLTDNGLHATRNVLIPALAESTSKRALELLFDHIESLELDYDIAIEERGVVANRVESTNEGRRMLEWFAEAFPDVPVWEVRKRVALQRAFSEGVSLFEYDPTVDMTETFLEVAADLDRQFGFDEAAAVTAEAGR